MFLNVESSDSSDSSDSDDLMMEKERRICVEM